MNKWIIAIIYASLLTTLCYLSIDTLLSLVSNATTFPILQIFVGILGLIFGMWILTSGIKKYISFATEDEKERRKLKNMFSIISVLSCYATIMLFFI